MRSTNSLRSGPSALGLRSTPLRPSHVPASRRRGPRLASVSGSTSAGSVKISSGISLTLLAPRFETMLIDLVIRPSGTIARPAPHPVGRSATEGILSPEMLFTFWGRNGAPVQAFPSETQGATKMPERLDVALIIGSLRKESFTRKFAHAAIAQAPEELQCRIVEIGDLAMYNQDL